MVSIETDKKNMRRYAAHAEASALAADTASLNPEILSHSNDCADRIDQNCPWRAAKGGHRGDMVAVTKGQRAGFMLLVLSMLAVLVGSVPQSLMAATTPPTCASPAPGEPMLITEDCVDPRFNDGYAFIDIDEVRQLPVPHRFVHGGFQGTDARFGFYFPEPAKYKGRFIQGPVHQLLRLTNELATPDEISFAFDSGAYLVETNNGGTESCLTTRDGLAGRCDPAVRGYRVNAAAAKFSRVQAAKIYGNYRPYGYLYGGSGGSYMTISSAEQTRGVWDGFVPFVMGTPNTSPDQFAARLHALRVLRQRNKFPEIMDAIDPGGSGNMYATLNAEESAALRELTRLGFPPRAWWDHATMTGGYLNLVAEAVPLSDPTYVDDFWSQPGYLGHDDPNGALAAARIQHAATVLSATPPVPPPTYETLGPVYPLYMFAQYTSTLPPREFVLSSLPPGDPTGADLVITSGAGMGKRCSLSVVQRDTNVVSCGGGSDPAVMNSIAAGDAVRVDNSWYLALQTHHRHQVPTRDMYGWNQFRNGGSGSPVYPQRDILIGPITAFQASGSISTGRFNGKMIVVENLMDADAFPWPADWYRTKVKAALSTNIDDQFRLWFTDHAQHGFTNDRAPYGFLPATGEVAARTVDYKGMLQQALRDLMAWVEQGVPPPATTSYQIVDGAQVQVPATAPQRRGIQPVVDLQVNGGVRAEVVVGQPVTFTATIQVPPGAGKVVEAEWDFTGSGTFISSVGVPIADMVTVQATFIYPQSGTYFPVLRATSQRQGDPNTPHARIQNLGRVRVVVH